MISLQDLIGKEIIASIPIFHRTTLQKMKLINVESSGLWVESRTISDSMLKHIGYTYSPKSVIFFLPFHQIAYILESLDVPYISDEALK
jgi:hypothetical protein